MPRPRPTPATPFGTWLDQWLRDHPEYTLEEFGRQVGVSKSAVSLWITKRERTRIPVPRLRLIADTTGEPVENLEQMVYGAEFRSRRVADGTAPYGSERLSFTRQELDELLEAAAERALRKVRAELEAARAYEGRAEPPVPSPRRARSR